MGYVIWIHEKLTIPGFASAGVQLNFRSSVVHVFRPMGFNKLTFVQIYLLNFACSVNFCHIQYSLEHLASKAASLLERESGGRQVTPVGICLCPILTEVEHSIYLKVLYCFINVDRILQLLSHSC